jgi:hypothetical protein
MRRHAHFDVDQICAVSRSSTAAEFAKRCSRASPRRLALRSQPREPGWTLLRYECLSSRGVHSDGSIPGTRASARRKSRRTFPAAILVPMEVVNTSPVSCHRSPVASRSANCCARCFFSASTQRPGSANVRRDLRVLVSPSARMVRQTSMCGGTGGATSVRRRPGQRCPPALVVRQLLIIPPEAHEIDDPNKSGFGGRLTETAGRHGHAVCPATDLRRRELMELPTARIRSTTRWTPGSVGWVLGPTLDP